MVLALGFFAVVSAQQSVSDAAVPEGIVVRVRGLRNSAGQVLASLFKSADGFPSDGRLAFMTCTVPAGADGEVMVVFTNVPAGKYAVAVCHDENANGRLDATFWGRPKEGVAVYRESDMRFGAPSFKDSVFNFTNKVLKAEINIVYQ